jgi:hypothetical protein
VLLLVNGCKQAKQFRIMFNHTSLIPLVFFVRVALEVGLSAWMLTKPFG